MSAKFPRGGGGGGGAGPFFSSKSISNRNGKLHFTCDIYKTHISAEIFSYSLTFRLL